jgi:hypothetical protein
MTSFRGLKEDDFGQLRGSSWRNRNAIGGLLSATLRHQTGRSYRSWGVSRRLELHIALEQAYRFPDARYYAKLFIYTHTDLAIGYYIEPPGRGENNQQLFQHWHNFQQRIQQQPAMRAAILSPMANHGLKLTNYYEHDADGGVLQGIYAFNAGKLQFWHPDIQRWTDTNVNTLVHQIVELRPGQPDHLHLYGQIDKKTAIDMGILIVDPILKILRALLPLYEMTVAC